MLRVGIIGVGNMGSFHLGNFIKGNIKNHTVATDMDLGFHKK